MFEHGTPLLPGALTSQREFFLLRCELRHQLASDSIACKRTHTWGEDVGFQMLCKLFHRVGMVNDCLDEIVRTLPLTQELEELLEQTLVVVSDAVQDSERK